MRSMLVLLLKVPMGLVLLLTSLKRRSMVLVVRSSAGLNGSFRLRKVKSSGRSFVREAVALG